MSIQKMVDEKLHTAGFPAGMIARLAETPDTAVWIVSYNPPGKIDIGGLPSGEGATYFRGFCCRFDGVTLLIDQHVARDWGFPVVDQ
jgi:hypothetical protein